MAAVIVTERPDYEDAAQLITELEVLLSPQYPKESRHGFSIEELLIEFVEFFMIRVEGNAAGCGGIKLFGTSYGEIKRMYF